MSEGEDENEMHCGETGIQGMDRTESIGTSEGKGESEIQGSKLMSCKIEEDSEETDDDYEPEEIEDDSEETDDDDEPEEVSYSATSVSKYPHFVTTLKSYNIGRSFLTIPTKFAQSNIPGDVGDIILIDEEGKEWPIKLTRRSDGYGVHFGFGWYDFQAEKRLRKGDICLFEQENEDKLEFTVSIIRIRK
ncbi:B3 domain-containing protein Os03g0619600-like [Papaver somniferum]|uniref:B3 domain-containing protein Os03g0619600-like n=1 Tax=Papaver somniferum TaxID=3469 RepID=UPI000E6FCB20|nr:B3 domain-containing protein Os03g0619600-like [Papaver somniferum]